MHSSTILVADDDAVAIVAALDGDALDRDGLLGGLVQAAAKLLPPKHVAQGEGANDAPGAPAAPAAPAVPNALILRGVVFVISRVRKSM